MRESLGWITNCAHAEHCPQNWLERSVSELPCSVSCPSCRQSVQLASEETEFQAACAVGVAAWPVVPPIAAVGSRGTPEPDHPPQNPVEPLVHPNPPPSVESSASAPGTRWFVWLDSGERLAVDKDHMVIGRSRACDIILPSAKVSRQHATLSRMDGQLYIEDLGSANGVWKNGQRIDRDRIASGDIVVLSDETLRFEAQ